MYSSGKEKVLGATPQRFDEAAREIMSGLKFGRSPILLPSFQVQIVRCLRAYVFFFFGKTALLLTLIFYSNQ